MSTYQTPETILRSAEGTLSLLLTLSNLLFLPKNTSELVMTKVPSLFFKNT